jgi:hypothetical protein
MPDRETRQAAHRSTNPDEPQIRRAIPDAQSGFCAACRLAPVFVTQASL